MPDFRRRGFLGGAAAAVVIALGWAALAAGTGAARPTLPKPDGAASCVEPAEWMRAHHQELLASWRETVVREGGREYVNARGEVHPMSLTKGCLDCHGSRAESCAKCHDWAGVREDCWDCHVENR